MTVKTAYYWNKELTQRNGGPFCPERPDRLIALRPDVVGPMLKNVAMETFAARGAAILSYAHEDSYIELVRTAYEMKKRSLDLGGEVRATEDVFDQALLSASAGCVALDAMFEGKYLRAFCAIRPPGHHANQVKALGFCVFSNVAIAARHAQRAFGVARVLTIDWDIHPGNGTQEIFWEDPSVFTLSFHQDDLMPASGGIELRGERAGEGYNRNVPIAPETTAAEYMRAFSKILEQVTQSFRPELVIISAGFDAHDRDPVSKLGLSSENFAQLTRKIIETTTPFTGGKILSLLEGGYNPPALKDCVVAHCLALAEE
jgi:acetoin utilization deacetylase AcuC-like enzyme